MLLSGGKMLNCFGMTLPASSWIVTCFGMVPPFSRMLCEKEQRGFGN